MADTLEEAIDDIKKVQDFDAESLVQKARLGEMSFDEVLEPAKQIIDLYRRIPVDSIDKLPPQHIQLLSQEAKATYSHFIQIINFKLSSPNPEEQRQALVQQLLTSYQGTFSAIHTLISYLVSQRIDFSALEVQGRAAIATFEEERARIVENLKETGDEAARVLMEVRDTAGEKGVTQMATYFSAEAAEHKTRSFWWLIASIVAAAVVIIYSALTLMLYKWLAVSTPLEGAQLITSKILIFGVLAYALFQCVRSYSAHRHNYVTNKHRQNALLTYTTLAEAGSSPELRDAVLQHAAAAIYAPNDSGYLKGEERGYGAQSLLALLPRNPTSGTGL